MSRRFRVVSVALAMVGMFAVSAPSPALFAASAQGAKTEGTDRGNPSTKVWVNTRSHVYHCPGTRYYGNTKNGTYTTQAEAQKGGNRPAYGRFCK